LRKVQKKEKDKRIARRKEKVAKRTWSRQNSRSITENYETEIKEGSVENKEKNVTENEGT
jgi:hypothetical protein